MPNLRRFGAACWCYCLLEKNAPFRVVFSPFYAPASAASTIAGETGSSSTQSTDRGSPMNNGSATGTGTVTSYGTGESQIGTGTYR